MNTHLDKRTKYAKITIENRKLLIDIVKNQKKSIKKTSQLLGIKNQLLKIL